MLHENIFEREMYLERELYISLLKSDFVRRETSYDFWDVVIWDMMDVIIGDMMDGWWFFLISSVPAVGEDKESIKRQLRSFLKSIQPFICTINSHRVAIYQLLFSWNEHMANGACWHSRILATCSMHLSLELHESTGGGTQTLFI